MKSCVQHYKPSQSNLDREQRLALSKLKKNDSIIILPADKGNATVVMDRDSYKEKINDLLDDDETYTKLKRDPTKKIERSICERLKSAERNGEIDSKLKSKLSPQNSYIPQFYGLPKLHKPNIPLRPIVSSIGSPTYNLSKELARILSPLRGKTTSYIKNSSHFVEMIKDTWSTLSKRQSQCTRKNRIYGLGMSTTPSSWQSYIGEISITLEQLQ